MWVDLQFHLHHLCGTASEVLSTPEMHGRPQKPKPPFKCHLNPWGISRASAGAVQADRHAEASHHPPINLFADLFIDLLAAAQEEQRCLPHRQLSAAACTRAPDSCFQTTGRVEPRGT